MTVPVINAFVKQHPEVKITVVSRPFFKPMFDLIPGVTFFEADLKERHKGFFGLLKLSNDLKKQNINFISDLHNVLRSRIICAFAAIGGMRSKSVDKARPEKKALTRQVNKVFRQLKPVTQRYADVFSSFGYDVKLDQSALLPKQPIPDSAGSKNGKWIGIAPFAKHEGKVYPDDLMQEVVNELSKNAETQIFLFGAGSQEMKKLDVFADGKPNVQNYAGKSSFSDELALISNLDVMLSMDSGNAHLAAMFGVPTVTLWGATHPFAGFAPFLQPEENMLAADRTKYPALPTSVYGNKKVDGYEDAMRTITPTQVIQRVSELLK